MAVSLSTNPTAVSATISSAGLGTNLDVSTIVPQLVSAETSATKTRLNSAVTTDKSTISALGSIKSLLSSLQSSIEAMTKNKALTQLTATTGDSSVFTATASSSAAAGNYQVKVETLAAANSILSDAFTSSSTSVGSGTLTINAGGSSFDVTLSDGANSLADLRDAINSSADNTGVSATIITGTDGAHLLLSATKTGLDNAVSVDTSSLINFTTAQDASDAKISVAGVEHVSSGNTITDAIDGVTLNLASASPDTAVSLTVSADTSGAVTAVQSFASAYNAALATIKASIAYDSSTSSAGVLMGDPAIRALSQKLGTTLGSVLGTAVSGVNSLSQIGLTTADDGTLSVDTTTLQTALSQNPAGVQALLSKSGGVADQLDTLVTGYVQTDGLIDTETNGLQSQLDDLNNQLSRLSDRESVLTQQYTAQFNSINTVVSTYTNLSSYLTQQFAPKSSSSSG